MKTFAVTDSMATLEEIQRKYNDTLAIIKELNESLQALQTRDFKRFIMPILLKFQKEIAVLEERQNALRFENETLRHDIYKLKQLLPDGENKAEENENTESSLDCQLIDCNDIKIVENIDYNSLKPGDDRWSNKIFKFWILSSLENHYL